MNPWHIHERVHSVTSAPYLSGGMNSSFPQCKSALNLYWKKYRKHVATQHFLKVNVLFLDLFHFLTLTYDF